MRRCLNCMQETTSGVCPYCGYDKSAYELQPGALKPQTRLKNRYYIGRVLGRGGFGITYNGWDAQAGRRVAIKEYFPSGLVARIENSNTVSALSSANTHAYKSGVVKFFDEAQILSEFGGVKEIVEIYDFFYENETSYIVMEYVEGQNILQVMTHQKYIDTGTAAGIILSLTGAMIKVHAQDVLHRDISPSNIILTGDGGIKLIDFGSARQFTADQQNSMSIILKNGFAPAEQYSRKGNHGPWTDVYGICATFYYMITGKLPEQATDRLIEDSLIPPSKLGAIITSKQEAVLLKGLAVKAGDRYQSTSELKSAMEEAFGKHKVTAPVTPVEEQKTAALEEEPASAQKEKTAGYMPVFITMIFIAIIILTLLSLTVWRRPAEPVETAADTTAAEESERAESEAAVRMTETDPAVSTAVETKKTVPAETKPAAAAVTVKPGVIHAESVTLNAKTFELQKGYKLTLTATVSPSNTTDKKVTWTSGNTGVASVTAGKVTALAAGTAVITARTSNGKTASCTVTVKVISAEKITIKQPSLTLSPGGKAELMVTVSPANADDRKAALTSSDPSVAAVNGFTVTAKNPGSATITAKTSNGKTDTCAVTVKAIQAAAVTLNKNTLTLKPGETAALTATITPSNTTDKKVTWLSNNDDIALINGGKVTAVSAGKTKIAVVSSNGKTAECTVTVISPEKTVEVSSVSISQNTMTLSPGDTGTLTAAISPANAANKTLTWTSSNNGVAAVAGGRVTAVSAGNAVITARTSNGRTASCSVTVKASIIYAESVSLDTTAYELLEGDFFNLTATIYPSNTADKTVTWISSNTRTATVAGGKVTAVSSGTAVITAKTSNDKVATCTVTVKSNIIEAEWISLDTKMKLDLHGGTFFFLTVIFYPEETTDKTITWTTSSEVVARVDDGMVTLVSPGVAVITATTSNGKVATCTVGVVS